VGTVQKKFVSDGLSAVRVSRRFPANVDQACNLAKSVTVESDARVFRPPWR
jgi:hypothetical protein